MIESIILNTEQHIKNLEEELYNSERRTLQTLDEMKSETDVYYLPKLEEAYKESVKNNFNLEKSIKFFKKANKRLKRLNKIKG